MAVTDAAKRPRLLDLFCCQGGASMGYHRAGFDVEGVDISPQPRYPFTFHQADALEFVKEHGHEFDVIHASPPCQFYSRTQKIQKNSHPDLIAPTREALQASDKLWIIENVPGSPLVDAFWLCGTMFGLATYRHRWFETNFSVEVPLHFEHRTPVAKMGRPAKPGEFLHIVGNFSGVVKAREIMGMQWASRDGLREAIPPAYTEYIGRQLLKELGSDGNPL